MTVANSPHLTYRDADHRYFYRGVELPSVTGLIKPVMPDHAFADPTLGTLVHELTAAADNGLHIAIPESALPYMEAWCAFRKDFGFVPELVEARVCHPGYGFAGTLDRAGRISGHDAILDIKTGEPEPWHGIQLAAYDLALGDGGPRDRYGVYLGGDGKYRLRHYADATDYSAFRALVSLHNWRSRHAC